MLIRVRISQMSLLTGGVRYAGPPNHNLVKWINMAVREITEGVYSVGVIDWDREVFDEIMPLTDGTTYNSYLVKGSEKTALIDTVDAGFDEELITNLARSGINGIDYVIINHAEQDHSGAIIVFLEFNIVNIEVSFR